jgi:hypothetical protein
MKRYSNTFSGAFGPGFVYLMQTGELYKIGYSVDPEARLDHVRVYDPMVQEYGGVVELLYTIPVQNMRQSEAALHVCFEDRRVYRLGGMLRTEWFRLSSVDVAQICAGILPKGVKGYEQ